MKNMTVAKKRWLAFGAVVVCCFAAFQIFFVMPLARMNWNMTDYGSLEANQAALQRDPNDPRAHRGMAEYYARQYDFVESIKERREAVRLLPSNGNDRLELAIILLRDGQRDEATAIMKELAQQNDTTGSFATKFLAKWKQKDEEAAPALDNPNDPNAHQKLARYYLWHRNFEESIKHWREAARLQPDNKQHRYMLAITLHRAGQQDEAMAIMKELGQQNDGVGRVATKVLAAWEREAKEGKTQ